MNVLEEEIVQQIKTNEGESYSVYNNNNIEREDLEGRRCWE